MPRNGLRRKEERLRPKMRELHELPEIVNPGLIDSILDINTGLLGSSVC